MSLNVIGLVSAQAHAPLYGEVHTYAACWGFFCIFALTGLCILFISTQRYQPINVVYQLDQLSLCFCSWKLV